MIRKEIVTPQKEKKNKIENTIIKKDRSTKINAKHIFIDQVPVISSKNLRYLYLINDIIKNFFLNFLKKEKRKNV